MRASHAALTALAIIALACGCLLENDGGYACPDGSVVPLPSGCKKAIKPTTTLDMTARMGLCAKLKVVDDRNACYTNLALDTSDLSVCHRTSNDKWLRYCYGKLNMSMILPPESTTTTLYAGPSVTVSSTTTTTTLMCGNGVIDEGEDCDGGQVCSFADGVCRVEPTEPPLAVCLSGTTCQWQTQVSAQGSYDMGSCNGCYGRGPKACRCFEQTVINVTNKPGGGSSGAKVTKTGSDTHAECLDGLCRKVSGSGKNLCSIDSTCRHYECISLKCELVRTPGTSSCAVGKACVPTTTTTIKG